MKAYHPILPWLLLAACTPEYEAPMPDTRWDLFESSSAVPVDATAQHRMEGVFAVTEGAAMFGDQVVLQWTWTRNGADTAYGVSIFCEKDLIFLTGGGKYLDSTLLLNTSWRAMANQGTGLCRLTIPYAEGVRQLWNNAVAADSIVIHGVYGNVGELPERSVTLKWQRPLNHGHDFHTIGHRGGGRNADLLPVSENSLEMIRMATRLGCTGIEIDVRMTSDGVPVIYHDATLNTRCIQECGLYGPIEEYSYAQLSGIVRLIHGERIPTLREALGTVIDNTPLRQVWLDTKVSGAAMARIRDIQTEYMNAAAAAGRDVRILIGLPAEEQVDAFLALPDHESAPALCELTIDDVHATNAEVWAPRWTLGLQPGEVQQMHGEGRKVYVWTLDVPVYVQEFMYQGGFDGVLSNYPMIVNYYDHARQ